MRLTTKIITGIILSIFLLSLLFIIAFSFSDRKYNVNAHYINTVYIPQGHNATIKLEPHQVIVFEAEDTFSDNDTAYYFSFNETSGLFLNPATAADSDSELIIPEALSGCITTQTNNDTLTVILHLNEVRQKYSETDKSIRKRKGIRYLTLISGINLYLYTARVNVINNVNHLQMLVNNIVTDSIMVNSAGGLVIDSCRAAVMIPVLANYNNLTIKNSGIQALHLDLDKTGKWTIENCDIEKEILSGSGRHHTTNNRQESRKLTWNPKNESAELVITLKNDTAQIIFP